MPKRGGWDNHPEYCGLEPTWREVVAIALVMLALGALLVYALPH